MTNNTRPALCGFSDLLKKGTTQRISGRVAMVLGALFMLSSRVQAQFYHMNNGGTFERYNFAANTATSLTAMAPAPGGNAATMAGVGANYIYATSVNSTVLRRYDIAATTWSTVTSTGLTSSTATSLWTDGTNLYYKSIAQGSTGAVYQYNAGTGAFTANATIGSVFKTFSGVGVLFTTTGTSTSSLIQKYDAVANTLTTVGNCPTGMSSNANLCADATNVWMVGGGGTAFAKVNIATGVGTVLAVPPASMNNGLVSDGTDVYGKFGANIYKYTSSTNTWSTPLTTSLSGSGYGSTLLGTYYVPVAIPCQAPTATAAAVSPTCNVNVANSDGTLRLTAFDVHSKKVGYCIGSTYTGPDFMTATTVSGGAPFTIVNTLPNPVSNQDYTIRVYCDAGLFTDYTVSLVPNPCPYAIPVVCVSTTAAFTGDINLIIDEVTPQSLIYYTGTAQAVAGKSMIRFDFAAPILLTGFEYDVASGAYIFANGAVLKTQGSNDGTTWTDLATYTRTATTSAGSYGAAFAETFAFASNTTLYSSYRLLGVSGTSREFPWLQEVFFSPTIHPAPCATVSSTPATCTAGVANSNGKLNIATFTTNANKVGYNLGTTYSGPAFAMATTVTGTSNFAAVTTLPNPTFNQPYTMRIFKDQYSYVDKQILLAPVICASSDLSITVNTATQTGNAGETLTYIVTLTNGGPTTAANVVVEVPTTEPMATLLTAVAASGTYSTTMKEWTVPSLAVGSTTLTLTVKVN